MSVLLDSHAYNKVFFIHFSLAIKVLVCSMVVCHCLLLAFTVVFLTHSIQERWIMATVQWHLDFILLWDITTKLITKYVLNCYLKSNICNSCKNIINVIIIKIQYLYKNVFLALSGFLNINCVISFEFYIHILCSHKVTMFRYTLCMSKLSKIVRSKYNIRVSLIFLGIPYHKNYC